MKNAESILSALAEPILLLDASLVAVLANPAFCNAFLADPIDLPGKSLTDLIGTENGSIKLATRLDSVIADDTRMEEIEFHLTPQTGTAKTLLVSAKCIHLGGAPTAMLLLEIRDVTREKDAERKIQELNEALRQRGAELEVINQELEFFTHAASHDLRSPLRLTNKIASLLLEDRMSSLPEASAQKIQMIIDSTDEMGKLIDDLLVFSRVKHEPMRKRLVNVERLAHEAMAELREEYEHRNLDVSIEKLPAGNADPALLKQVFMNLLGNAFKFTGQRETAVIRVGFTLSQDETIYYVRDNGIGFDMDRAAQMFKPFHRLHNSHGFEGSGIGLALVKRIVDYHGGRLWAEGAASQGATIYFALG